MFFNDGFIGYAPDSNPLFSGGDGETMYLDNLKTQPKDWYYRHNNDISYDYNSLGHRCKDIKDINLDNYILFSGCSHTEGIGLKLEKTFPYLVAERLGIDYYNLAIGGSGLDTMTYNLVTWISKVKKPPKALIILWPSHLRFVLQHSNILEFVYPGTLNSDHCRFLVDGDTIGYFRSMEELNKKLIQNCYSETKIIIGDQWELEQFDLARDLSHSGIISNGIFAKRLIRKLK